MALGADGVISVASNVAPGPVSELVQAAARGDMSRARALHRALTPLFKACFVESNPIPVKAALSVLGLCAPRMRSPLSAPVPDTVALMRRTLAALFPDVKTD
jgi:4-hydroxy-tetrahydrodipicolinate synthase